MESPRYTGNFSENISGNADSQESGEGGNVTHKPGTKALEQLQRTLASVESETSAQIAASGPVEPWSGTDWNSAKLNKIHNGLVHIILKPDTVSDSEAEYYFGQSQRVLDSFAAQARHPRTIVKWKMWLGRKIATYRDMRKRAIDSKGKGRSRPRVSARAPMMEFGKLPSQMNEEETDAALRADEAQEAEFLKRHDN